MAGSDSNTNTWVAKKPVKRLGGMSDALSLAADLGFSVNPPPSQVPFFMCMYFVCICLCNLEFCGIGVVVVLILSFLCLALDF